jgi:hypothetical protein
MRVRDKSTVIPCGLGERKIYSLSSGEHTSTQVTAAYPWKLNDKRWISDETGYRGITHNCMQDRMTSRYIPYNGTYTGNTARAVCDNASFISYGLADISRPGFSDWTAFNQRAFDAMKPDLETELNLTSSLIELTDIASIGGFLTNWSGSLLRKIAEGHLTYSFALRPLMSDVQGVYQVLTTYSDRINKFLADRRKPLKRHYTEGVATEEITDSESSTYVSSKFTSEVKRELHATMRYTYDCPDLVTFGQKLNALRDMLGLRLGPKQLWEAIPFSFVVDWFIRVGDWIDRYEKPLIEPEIRVTDYCISERITWKSERKLVYQSSNDRLEHTDFQEEGKRYWRKRCLPDAGNTFVEQGHFGLNQLALSASLFTVFRAK